MQKAAFRLATVALLAGGAIGQQSTEAQRIPSTVKHAGVYHLATGTWTRGAGSSAQLGPDVIYNNTAVSGYFMTTPIVPDGDTHITDEGRIPKTTSAIMGTAPVAQDVHVIDGLEFAYCSDIVGPNVDLVFNLYDTYSPCDQPFSGSTDPIHQVASLSIADLPGSSAGVSCWEITLDLEGAGEFCMEGEGGPLSQGTVHFGIEWIFQDIDGSQTGPLIAGNPDWTANVPGAALHGGAGTYYYSAPDCMEGSTGLDTRDFFNFDGPPSASYLGCRFFGGYKNLDGCSSTSQTPFASFHTILFGDRNQQATCTDIKFCSPANPSGSGTPVTLTSSPAAVGSGLHIDGSGGPPPAVGGSFGFFLVSSQIGFPITVGQGLLCLQEPIGRYNPAFGGAGNSLFGWSATGDIVNLAGTSTTGLGFDVPTQLPPTLGGSIVSGSTWHFQAWFRDINPFATVNFSEGLSYTF